MGTVKTTGTSSANRIVRRSGRANTPSVDDLGGKALFGSAPA
jgi:hypothetical protein